MDVLVVGSAHIDVVAEYDAASQGAISDKIGSSVTLSYGGVALNVTAHLRDVGQDAHIFTAFNRNTLSGRSLLSALKSGGIPTKFVINDTELPESAYVGHMAGGRVESAISSMSVGESRKLSGRLESVVRKFDWVVFDCNLSRGMIEDLAEICEERGINLVGLATSDAKAERLSSARSHGMRAASMNQAEFDQLLIAARRSGSISGDVEGNEALSSVRMWLNTNVLLVTAGRNGWYLADSSGVRHYRAPEGIVPVNSLGAGDAAAAGLVDSLIRDASIADGVERTVARALRSLYPTRFAQRTSPEAWPDQKRRNQVLSIARYVALVVATVIIEILFFRILDLL